MKIYKNMNSSNTALLVIDVINSCAHEDCEIPKWNVRFSKIREMAPKLEKFIEHFRRKTSSLVIFTNCKPWKKEFLADNLNKLYTDSRAAYYSTDTSGFPEKFYLVSPKDKDVVITKNTYDAFASGELDKILKEKGIKYLVVAGGFTDGCVLASIVGGFSKGYNFVILKDLIETTDVEIRQKLSEQLKEYTFPVMYGKTINSSDFLKNWLE